MKKKYKKKNNISKRDRIRNALANKMIDQEIS